MNFQSTESCFESRLSSRLESNRTDAKYHLNSGLRIYYKTLIIAAPDGVLYIARRSILNGICTGCSMLM